MNSKHVYEEEEEKVSLGGEDGKGKPKTQAPARGGPGATGRKRRGLLIGEQVADGGGKVVGLGEDGIFEMRVVSAESVTGGDAFDGSIEIGEEFFGDTRGDFGTVAPAHHVFIGNDDAMGFADSGGDGFPI